MSVETTRAHVHNYSIISLKLMYYYAKAFGIVCFEIAPNKKKMQHSLGTHIFCIIFRLFCLIVYVYYLPRYISLIQQQENRHVLVIIIVEQTSLVGFSILFILFQAIEAKAFIKIVNRTIEIFNQISHISKDLTIYEQELYLMVFGRIACNISIVIADAPTFAEAVEEHDSVFIIQSILRYALWFGTVIVVDILCLGYITAAGMYRNIGDHMTLFAKRIEASEICSMSKFRRMQMLCDFSEELDECSAIYSQVFMVTQGFHKLFQFYIFFTLYMELLIVVSNMHRVFLVYMADGIINWSKLAVSLVQAIDFLLLMLLADLVTRRSRIPKHLNLDVFCSDIESRWDRSVEQFLNQRSFEDVRFDVYGLFELNNEFVLQVFSAIVAYFTILIQFKMLGFFVED